MEWVVDPVRISRDRTMAAWLLVLCGMVFVMIVLGGVTRLTYSGLSMVEWKPITGWLPPMGEAEWEAAFARYREFPEYRELNAGMSLAGFKGIFWMEFVHRLWGRLIGVAFLVPFAVFYLRGWVERRLIAKLAGIFVLGGLQGALGWYMVTSGLVDEPDVSAYRLSAHLILAVAIYGVMMWVAMTLLHPQPDTDEDTEARGRWRFAVALAGLIALAVLSGGLVAGIDAGFYYNTFPLMAGEWLPQGLFAMDPAWASPFEDVTTVQFDHRVLATLVLAAAVVFWLVARRAPLPGRARLAVALLPVAALIQVGLGVATLLLVVPVPLAAAHQAGALVLFSAALWTVHELRPAAA